MLAMPIGVGHIPNIPQSPLPYVLDIPPSALYLDRCIGDEKALHRGNDEGQPQRKGVIVCLIRFMILAMAGCGQTALSALLTA